MKYIKNLFKFTSLVKKMVVITCLVVISKNADAQLNPLAGAFYQNQYLVNPALAGRGGGITLNFHYRNQWSSVPGAPVNYALTGEFGLKDGKSAVGINAYSDKAGLLTRTRAVASYAYHLQLDGAGSELHFGVSIGFMNEHLNDGVLNGDGSDISIGNFNNQPRYVDGDFGVAYTGKQLSIQGAVPNLNSFFNRDRREATDIGTYYAAVGYKLFTDEQEYGYNVEPKVAYRGVRGQKDLLDVGAQLTLGRGESRASAMIVYHSTKNVAAGVGMLMKSKYQINAMYSSQTAALNSYTNGTFEIGLGLKL